MDLNYVLLLGVLLVVLITPIKNLTNKTVQPFKKIFHQRSVKKVLCEVTHVLPTEIFSTVPHIGVAKEIVSPNSLPCLTDGWKHIGDKITFIFCNKKGPVSFWLAKKKILIWEKNGEWFFCDSNNERVFRLNRKNSQLAETLFCSARIFSLMTLRCHIQKSSIYNVEIETV